VLAQVLIRRDGRLFELRHVEDRQAASETLRFVSVREVRALAQFTADGAFRPLRSAPDLQKGWRLAVRDEAELETALNQIYPGAIADGFAARSPNPPVTNYREFTARQTGIYEVTATLGDRQAAQVIRSCCASKRCLKQRLWTAEGLAPDAAEEKSLIPCLEPCALLLESARRCVQPGQDEKVADL
jgi:hypothetical protein